MKMIDSLVFSLAKTARRVCAIFVMVQVTSGCAQLVGTPMDGARTGADVADASAADPFEPGAACASAEECTGVGAVCERGSFGGYCTRPCSGTGSECGALGLCVRGTCRRVCPRLSDCRAGSPLFVCASVAGQMACLPKCNNDAPTLCGEWSCQGDGLCFTSCMQFLPNDLGCSRGSLCSARNGGICRCSNTTDCGAGRMCNTTTGACQTQ